MHRCASTFIGAWSLLINTYYIQDDCCLILSFLTSSPFCPAGQLMMARLPLMKSFWTSTMMNADCGRTIWNFTLNWKSWFLHNFVFFFFTRFVEEVIKGVSVDIRCLSLHIAEPAWLRYELEKGLRAVYLQTNIGFRIFPDL